MGGCLWNDPRFCADVGLLAREVLARPVVDEVVNGRRPADLEWERRLARMKDICFVRGYPSSFLRG